MGIFPIAFWLRVEIANEQCIGTELDSRLICRVEEGAEILVLSK
jgi:hypothetical protein